MRVSKNIEKSIEETKVSEGIKELVDYDRIIQALAYDRTKLANERTLLAYVRTGLSLVVLGIALIKLFEDGITYYSGIIINTLGVIMLVIGITKYYQISKDIKKYNNKTIIDHYKHMIRL